jgi:hypothetical protein
MVFPEEALLTAAFTVFNGFDEVPEALSLPLPASTKTAPEGTEYAVVPTAAEPREGRLKATAGA